MTSQAERARLQDAEQLIRTFIPFQAVPICIVGDICSNPLKCGLIVHDCKYKDGVLEWSFIYYDKYNSVVKRSCVDSEWKRLLGVRNYNEMYYQSDEGKMALSNAMTVTSSSLFRSVLDLAATEMPRKYTGPIPAYEESLSKRARPTRYVDHESSEGEEVPRKEKKKKAKGKFDVDLEISEAPVQPTRKAGSSTHVPVDIDDYDYVASKVTEFVKQLQQNRTTGPTGLDSQKKALADLQDELRLYQVDNTTQHHEQATKLWKANITGTGRERSWQIHDAFGKFSSMFVGGGIRGAMKLNNQLYLMDIINFFFRHYPSHLVRAGSALALPHIDLLHQTHSKFSTFEVNPAWNYIQSIQYTPLGKHCLSELSNYWSTKLDGSEWKCGPGEHYLFRYNEVRRLSELTEYKGQLGRGYYYSLEVPTTAGFDGADSPDPGYHTIYIDRVYTGNVGQGDDIQQEKDCDSYRNHNLIAVAQKRSCCPFLRIVYKFCPETTTWPPDSQAAVLVP